MNNSFFIKVDLTFTLKFLLTMEATIRTSNADTNMHVLYITFDLTMYSQFLVALV